MLSALRPYASRRYNAPVAFCHNAPVSFSTRILFFRVVLFLLLLLAPLGFAPAASAQTVTTVNDTDSGFTYTGPGWFYSENRGFLDYNDDEHGTNNVGDSVSYTFTGTGIAFLAESESSEGNVKVYLDGAFQATVNLYSATHQASQTQWSISGLASGSHTLKLVAQDGTYMELDAVQVTATSSMIGTGEVHFYPRPGYEWRMPGGKFQGSNDGSTYTDLYTITATPAGQVYTTVTLSVDPVNYRYLRYLGPNGSAGNIAELAFYSGTGANAIKLTGAGFGTPVSYSNAGNDFTKALDGNVGSFFDAPAPGNGDYVGIDQQGAPLGTQALAINASGGAASPYVADTDYSGGGTSSTTTAIDTTGVTSPAPQAVYQSQRYGSFTYTLPNLTPGASYMLRMHFAEIYFTSANQRQFNVSINGTQVLNNFDIYASAGGANRAVVESFPVTASSGGAISVQFSAGSADNPALNGLEVLKVPPAAASQVRFVPRSAYESRMVGGKFQGSNDGSSYTDLVTVAQQPARGQFTTLTFPGPATYRYLRYLSPDGNYGNIAELEFDKGTGSSAVKLAGSGFGTPGSYAGYGNDFTKVFDGDLSTFFDAPDPGNGDYVGIDQGGIPPPSALWAAAGNASVSLVWNATSGFTGYNVYRSTASSGPFAVANSSAVTSGAYTDTSLINGTTYYYFVTGLSAGGESASSNQANATPTATPAPPKLSAKAVSSTQITLTWTSVAGATSYNLYRGTSAGGESSTVYKSGITPQGPNLTYPDTGNGTALSTSQTYYYKVTAVSSSGEGSRSNEASAMPSSTALSAPMLKGVAGNGQATLTWSSIANAISYNLYRVVNPGGYYGSNLYKTGLTNTSFTDIGLTNSIPPGNSNSPPYNTSYSYIVTAVAAAGEGATSNSVTLTPGTSALAAPNLSARASAPGASTPQITLTWSPVIPPSGSSITGYNLYRGTAPGGEGSTPYQVNVGSGYGPGLSYSDTGNGTALSTAQTYYYKIVAVGPGGEGVFSNEASATPGSTALTAPLLKAVSGNAQATLTWSSVANATSYNLYRSVGSMPYGPPTLYKSGLTNTTLTDIGLSNGTTYIYSVRAVAAGGEGPTSISASAIPGSAALSGANLTAQASAPGASAPQVTLAWAPVSPPSNISVSGYNLYRSTTPGGEGNTPYQVNAGFNSTGTFSYQDTAVATGTTYYYKVTAVGSGGEGPFSNEASATPGATQVTAPLGLTATADPTRVAINIAWSAVSGAASYNLYRFPKYGRGILYAIGLTSTSYTDTNLIPQQGGGFGYYATAVSKDGEGPVSNTQFAIVNGFYITCPASVTITHGATAAVNLVLTPLGNYAASVMMSGSATPTGTQGLFYPAATVVSSTVDIGYSVTGNLYFNVGSTTAPGSYPVTVTGTGTVNGISFSYSTNLTLIVQ